MRPQLSHGTVLHARLRPLRNAFCYRVFFLRFALSELHRLDNAVFPINRWNLFSFQYQDHGARDGSHPESWIRALLAQEGLNEADAEIWLQAFPRMLGYVFNPVSFWLCHDKGGAIRAVLCEVNNTFGEHHHYLLAHPDHRPILDSDIMTATKVFHVSPFCDIAGEYRFQFNVEEASTHTVLAWAGYEPGAVGHQAGSLAAVYALLPCAIKLGAAGLLWIAPLEHSAGIEPNLNKEAGA